MLLMGKNPKSAKKAERSGEALNLRIDEDLYAAMEEYIADNNSRDVHKASKTSTVELALKQFLKTHGFWPRKDQHSKT
jgi:hypothetical protein